jgi:cyclic pyranopterin phosphate synthase
MTDPQLAAELAPPVEVASATSTIANTSPLIDRLGRMHHSLRISVTDRCNIRCFYCMPHEDVRFKPRGEILSFEEITRFASIVSHMGVRRLRLTGGEPLVRTDLPHLVEQLAALPHINDLALTTNGILLADQAAALRAAGLLRINISLDTLDEATFGRITRRAGLDRVLAGIEAAIAAAFESIRLNAVAIRGLTEREIVPLAKFARDRGLELRFIEYMPLDAEQHWQPSDVLDGEAIRRVLEAEFGPVRPIAPPHRSQPAVDFEYADGGGRVGLIHPVSRPFCDTCDRLRLTAEGQVRNCLFSTVEWDARALLRGNGSNDEIAQLVRDCVWAKAPAHGIGTDHFVRPERAMYQIGG